MTPWEAEHHACRQYAYGDQSVVRECCVEAAATLKHLAQVVAFTDSHPAVRAFFEREAGLTTAEVERVRQRVPGSPTIYGAAS